MKALFVANREAALSRSREAEFEWAVENVAVLLIPDDEIEKLSPEERTRLVGWRPILSP